MDLVFGFFMGLSFWPMVIILAATGCLFFVVEIDNAFVGLIVVLVAAAALYFVTNFNPFFYLWHHPLWIVPCIVGYAVLGGLWSIYKWRHFSGRVRERFNEAHLGFTQRWMTNKLSSANAEQTWKNFNLDEVNGEKGKFPFNEGNRLALIAELEKNKIPDCLLERWHNEDIEGVPLARTNKMRILTWIAYWPWSAIWYVFRDLVMDIANWIWKHLLTVYKSIAESAFKDVDPRLLRKPS